MADFRPPAIIRKPATPEEFARRLQNWVGEPKPEPEPELRLIHTKILSENDLDKKLCRFNLPHPKAVEIYDNLDNEDILITNEKASFKAFDAKGSEYSFIVKMSKGGVTKCNTKKATTAYLMNSWTNFLEQNNPQEGDELQIWWNDLKNCAVLLIKEGHHVHQETYTVLRESDIRQRQEESISHVSDVLSISRVAASILLCNYKWNVSQLHDEWFADEDRIRNSVGLLSKPVVLFPNANELTCGICFDSYPCDQIHSVVCGHPYCTTCWKGYITTSISDGPKCLLLRCPAPDCSAAVGHDMILKLASDEDNEKYSRYLVQSYIVDKEKTKWCPAPDCENAVEFELGSIDYDVTCLCSHAFCWNCTEEAHHPVDCNTVANWILKKESENMNWVLANSKPCPKCKRPIEKNQGCMHMSCTPPCKFEFCWLCLGAWSDHEESTGGLYACNCYEAAKQEGLYDEAEKRSEMAKNSLERYIHYYERWASNQTSRQKAIADLHQMQTIHLEKLSDKLKKPKSRLKFITEAWQQIIECRQVLKWTYAYGYYLPENETAKRVLFEYLQGDAEAALERLHQCAEHELVVFLGNDDGEADSQPNFKTFRPKLAGLTRVTRLYFENFVRELKDGFIRS